MIFHESRCGLWILHQRPRREDPLASPLRCLGGTGHVWLEVVLTCFSQPKGVVSEGEHGDFSAAQLGGERGEL